MTIRTALSQSPTSETAMPGERTLLGRSIGVLQDLARILFIVAWSIIWMSIGALLGALRLKAAGLAVGPRFWAPGLLWACAVRLDVRRSSNIDWSKRYIIVANHQSIADVAALQAGLPASLRFVAKTELGRAPFLGNYLRNVGMVCVDRANTAASVAILEALAPKVARDGACLTFFAEGTRSHDGAILPFKKGAFMVAIAAGVPILPVSIEGSRRVMPAGGLRPRPGFIRVDIGEPIPTDHLAPSDRDSLMAEARQAIVTMNLRAGGKGASPDGPIASPAPVTTTSTAAMTGKKHLPFPIEGE